MPRPGVKQATNLSIRRDLLLAARAQGINLSQTLEAALVAQIAIANGKRWQHDNAAAIAAYNSEVERVGVFSEAHRDF